MRSDEVKQGLDRAGHRSLLMATGVTKEQFKSVEYRLEEYNGQI